MIKYKIYEHRHDQIRYIDGATIYQMIEEDCGLITEIASFRYIDDAENIYNTYTISVYTYAGKNHLLCDITYYTLEAVVYGDDGVIENINTIRSS